MAPRQTPGARRGESRSRSGRARALIAVAGGAASGTGLGVQGTMAFFTDSATVNTGSFTSGTLDVTIDGQLAGQANNSGTMTLSLAASNLLPGESVAYSFPIRNNGTSAFTYSVAATGSGGLAVTNGLQYAMTFGGAAATNSGTEAAGNRVGSCGTTPTDANTTLLTSTPTNFVTAASPRTLNSTVSETGCIVVRLNSNAGNALQNLTGTASFVFSAKQPGA